MITFELKEPSGEVRKLRVPDYDDLTIAGWRLLTSTELPPGLTWDEYNRELLARHTGMSPMDVIRLRPKDYQIATETIAETVRMAMQTKAGTPDTNPPAEIEHEGVTYTVPQDLEQDTIIAQWIDLTQTDGLTSEIDVMVRTLAVLLIPKGQEYQGDYASRLEVMERFNLHLAFHLSAFFFDSSERYRKHMHHSFGHLLTWRWRKSEQGHQLSQSVTAHGR